MRVQIEPPSDNFQPPADDFQLPADDFHENFIVTVPSDRGMGSRHLVVLGAVMWQCWKAAYVLFIPLHSLETVVFRKTNTFQLPFPVLVQ